MEDTNNIFALTDENGEEVRFEFLDLIEYEDNEYVVLLPADDEAAGEVVILLLESTDEDADKEKYIGVEDRQTLETVFAIFKGKFREEFNFFDE